MPTKDVIGIEVEKRTDISEDTFKTVCDYVTNFEDSAVEINWLTDTTEKWCRDRAIYLALMLSIKVADGGDKKLSKDAIPGILQEALAVSFDEHIGHDYIEQAEARY